MIITTSQERALVDCCPCSIPECAAPRKECQSVALCGYAIPEVTGITDLQRVTRYAKIERTVDDVYTEENYARPYRYDPYPDLVQQSFWLIETSGTQTTNQSCTLEVTTTAGACDEENTATSYYQESNQKAFSLGDEYGDGAGDLISETTYFHESEKTGGTCTGTQWATGSEPSSPVAWNECSCVGLSYGGSVYGAWSLSGTTITRTGTTGVDSLPASIWSQEFTQSITFSEPVNTALEALAFDDTDAIQGDECTPFVTLGGGAVDAIGTVGKSRYRFGVPEDFSVEGVPRNYYEAQWDEVFFPTTGDPVYLSSHSWLWGGDMEAPWSDWFELPLLEAPGEIRVVNLRIKCYKSTRFGVPPTAIGEVYDIPT